MRRLIGKKSYDTKNVTLKWLKNFWGDKSETINKTVDFDISCYWHMTKLKNRRKYFDSVPESANLWISKAI